MRVLSTIVAITAEDIAIDAKHRAVGTSDADQCQFNKDTFIPYIAKTKQSVTLFVNCPKSGGVAAALAGEYEKALNDLDANRCPWSSEGDRASSVTFIHHSHIGLSRLWRIR